MDPLFGDGRADSHNAAFSESDLILERSCPFPFPPLIEFCLLLLVPPQVGMLGVKDSCGENDGILAIGEGDFFLELRVSFALLVRPLPLFLSLILELDVDEDFFPFICAETPCWSKTLLSQSSTGTLSVR